MKNALPKGQQNTDNTIAIAGNKNTASIKGIACI